MFLQIESDGRAINIGFHHFLSLSLFATRTRFAYVRNGLKHKFIRGYVPATDGREGGDDHRHFAPNYDRFEPSEIVQNRLSFCVSIFRSVPWLVQSADAIFLAKAVEINGDAVISLLRQNCTQDSTPRCVLRPSLRCPSLSLSLSLFLSASNPIKLEILLISQWRFRYNGPF